MRHPWVKVNPVIFENAVYNEHIKSGIVNVGEFLKKQTWGRITYNSYYSTRKHGYTKRQKVIDAIKEFYPDCIE